MKHYRSIWNSFLGRFLACLLISVISLIIIPVQAFSYIWKENAQSYGESFADLGIQVSRKISSIAETSYTVASFAGYSKVVQQYMLSQNPEEVILSRSEVMTTLSSILSGSVYCSNIILFASGGRCISANGTGISEVKKLVQGWEYSENAERKNPAFVRIPDGEGELRFFLFVPVYDLYADTYLRSLNVVVICDMSEIYQYVLSNPYADVIRTALSVDSLSVSFPAAAGENILSEEYLVHEVTIPVIGEQEWRFTCSVSKRTVQHQVFLVCLSLFIPYLLAVLVVILLLTLLYRSLYKNVMTIVTDINGLNLSGDNLEVNYIHDSPITELHILSDSVNQLARRLTETFEANQQMQQKYHEIMLQQAQAEFLAYRSQINPHFLFNTLECIRSLAHTRNEQCIENLALYMAHNFRYALYVPPVVSLSQEIAHVQNYLNVMNIRFNGKYKFKNQIACERCLAWQVPSMFLQPIMENSVKHAFVHSHKAECVISLQARIEGESRLVLHIADNGSGFPKEQQRKLESKVFFYSKNGCSKGEGEEGIGLSNVIWRMKLVYGSAFQFRIFSKAEHYTVFELVIPTLPENPDFSGGEAPGR